MNIVDLKFVPQGTPDLNIQAFDCGRKSVNDFFHNEAQDYQDELFGKTYYFCLPDSPSDIVAGFTVANASIFTKRLPNARQKKGGTRDVDNIVGGYLGREVHHEKGLINYPSILLAQLGVDVKYKGQHLGPQIIDFVMGWFTSASNKSGCRHLIVDAYDEPHLLEFYQRNGLNLFFSKIDGKYTKYLDVDNVLSREYIEVNSPYAPNALSFNNRAHFLAQREERNRQEEEKWEEMMADMYDAYENHRYDDMDMSPEERVMSALENGMGELYGY